MKERQILFSGPMVRAILEGRKTQTRRVAKYILEFVDKNVNGAIWDFEDRFFHLINDKGNKIGKWDVKCPYGQPGDRLWVRETCCIAPKNFAWPDDTCVKDKEGDPRFISYKATCKSEEAMRDYGLKWTPSILMPRWASRINLEIVNIRVERLQDISEEDAKAEGVRATFDGRVCHHAFGEGLCAICNYKNLWNSINGPGSWDLNPWVWVVEFKRV